MPFVIPVIGWRHQIFTDTRPRRRIFQALDQLGITAVMSPGRNECRHTVEPRGIGVGIGADIHAFSAGSVNFRHNLGHPSPVLFSCNLDVPDFHRKMAFLSDANRFIDGRQHGIAFIAHVSGVNPAKLSRFAGECNQFFCLSIRSRRVFQGSRNANRSFLHRLAHQFPHLLKLCRSGLLIVIAEDHAAHLRGTYVRGEINSHALFFQTGEILLKRSPVRGDVVVGIGGAVCLNDGVTQRHCRTIVARNYGRNALINFRRETRIDKNSQL